MTFTVPIRAAIHPTRKPGLRVALLLAFLLSTQGTQTYAAQGRPSEDDVKAAYLFNFGKFVRRPASTVPTASFDLCLVGQDDLEHVLKTVTSNEQIDGLPVHVKRFDKAADARSCAVIFLGASETAHLDKDIETLQGSNALTVSDAPHFLDHGGMIQFLLQNNRVRFAVNLEAVHHTPLQLSSELLKVAAYISGAPNTEVPQ